MAYLDLVTVVVFSLLVVGCGMSFSGSGKDMKSFFAGGGAVPWWISGLSLFMSFFSAGTFVVWGSIAYQTGWVAITIQWTMCLAGFIIGFVVAPKWQKTGVLTGAEFITQRLGYKTQKIYSYLFLFISIFTTGAFLYPVAKILEVYTGVPIALTTIVLGLLILLYTAAGGMWAVVVTDVLQFIVLTAAVLVVVPLAFEKIGGVSQLIERAPDHFFELHNHEYSIGFLFAFALYNLFFLSGNWTYIQRYTTVKSPGDAKKVGWLFGTLYAISPVIWMLPPMIYRVINPDLQQLGSEGAYLLVCKAVLPVGVMGLMLGGMVFATSSSVNTTLNISAGVFTNDLYKNFFPRSSEKRLMRVARLSTVFFGLLTIVTALLVPYLGGIVEVVLSLAALTGGAMYLPPLWALFSKKQTGKSVLSITIISLLINFFFKFIAPSLLGFSLDRSMEMIVGMGAPVLLLVAYEIWAITGQSANPDYENYLIRKVALRVPVAATSVSDSADNRKGKKVIAVGTIITGGCMLLLGIYAIHTTWYVLAMGVVIIIVGALIYKVGEKKN